MISTWTGVRARLERLAGHASPTRVAAVFGANGHRFASLPPLTRSELAEAEAQFRVELPEDYRSFLTEVSAGGAGPHYGLPLVRVEAGRWGWVGDGAELTDGARLATEFAPADIGEQLAALEAVRPSAEDLDAYHAWVGRCDDLLWAPDRTFGAACLCHQGCAHQNWLVVSGQFRGQVWLDERAGDVDLAPDQAPDGTVHTFATWYLTWLDQAEYTVFGRR